MLSIDWNLIITLWASGISIPVVGWFYNAYRQRKLTKKLWKYDKKAKHYGLLSEALQGIINSQSIIKLVDYINIKKEADLKTNLFKISALVGITCSETVVNNYFNTCQKIGYIEDLTIKKLQEMIETLTVDCYYIFYSSLIKSKSQREWIELYEPDNTILKELVKGWDILLNEEAQRMIDTAIFRAAKMEGFIPPDNPEWINNINLEYNKIRDLMIKDLEETL